MPNLLKYIQLLWIGERGGYGTQRVKVCTSVLKSPDDGSKSTSHCNITEASLS